MKSKRRLFLLCLLACSLTCAALSSAQQQAASSALDRDFKAAVAAYDAGSYAEATAYLEKLLPQAPNSFELHELLGLTYGAQSEDAKAVQQLQLAVHLKPDSTAARTNLATGLVRTGQPAEAEVQCRKALELAPGDYNANHNLAELYLRSNKLADALPLLQAAQHIRPGAYDNGYDLALADLLTGKLDESRQLVATLAQQRDTGELHNLLGRIDEKQEKYLDAANEFATAAHMDPSEDNLFVWASELLLHRTYVPAIEVFRQGTERYPNSPRLRIGLGMALYSRGDYEPSIKALISASDLNPGDPRCYLFLSKAYLSSPNQAPEVIERFRRYAELEPRTALAQYYYALSLWKGKRIEDADIDYPAVESLLQKSIALDPNIADAHLQLGILYNEQRAYAKALPEYERAVALNQNLPDAHFRLGQYYARAQDKTRAQSEFDLFKKLQAEHQAELDRERAEVQQFVISAQAAPSVKP